MLFQQLWYHQNEPFRGSALRPRYGATYATPQKIQFLAWKIAPDIWNRYLNLAEKKIVTFQFSEKLFLLENEIELF